MPRMCGTVVMAADCSAEVVKIPQNTSINASQHCIVVHGKFVNVGLISVQDLWIA